MLKPWWSFTFLLLAVDLCVPCTAVETLASQLLGPAVVASLLGRDRVDRMLAATLVGVHCSTHYTNRLYVRHARHEGNRSMHEQF